VANRLEDLRREGLGGKHTCGVAGVDTRLLDVLLDPANEHVPTVRDRVDIDLDCVGKVLVDEDGVLAGHLYGGRHVLRELLLGVDDLHRTPAEDIRGPYEDWVSDLRGDPADL